MTRKFEKISFNQFEKTINSDLELYNEYSLPKRSTKNSAGYDLFAISEIIINPGEIVKIPTGYKATFSNDEFLMICVRSGMGYKYNIRMCNQVGIIDSDYYNNESNEGHIFVALQNHGTEVYKVEKGKAYAQGIFMKYLITDDDECASNERIGGLGSTTKEKK